ncbi:MAG: decarboxylating NADP(+)-dependent phosphogluconate dehydrogenase [Lentisphaerae bacterium]|nr:decarboxylating NADP(+)-dependent phosphogluconate dehydrogenase [Lentisphaerota bacterium]
MAANRNYEEGDADIGVVGLAVMGENLILNMESKGFRVACYNRTVSKVDDFVNGRGKGKRIIGCRGVGELTAALKSPRRVMLMVKAGKPVDEFIELLLPHLESGDIVLDGGNSHYPDTVRRTRYLAGKGVLFIGTGVSGGEEGALKGPAIMPGGNPAAWPHVKPILQAIAAKAPDGSPCCEWMGPDGAGHFVKMVHNGIEYGDMQLICEAYDLMARGLGMGAKEMHKVFARWNRGALESYLIRITGEILAKTDDETGRPMVDVILDTAGQKGTGKWTSQAGLDLGIGIPQIAEAVFARCLSAIKDERTAAAAALSGPAAKFRGDKAALVRQLQDAVYAAKICSYAQGFQLLRAASAEYKWDLKYGEIALVWRSGCIIRARFLGRIKQAFDRKPDLANLLLDPYFRRTVAAAQDSWRKVVKAAVALGIPAPAMGAALSYYDSYRSARLPANLLQAQRDYFGAHTYERVDRPRGQFFHTDWTGHGGATSASTYVV